MCLHLCVSPFLWFSKKAWISRFQKKTNTSDRLREMMCVTWKKKIVGEKKTFFTWIAVLSQSLNKLWALIKCCHTLLVILVLLTKWKQQVWSLLEMGKLGQCGRMDKTTVTEEVKGTITFIWTIPTPLSPWKVLLWWQTGHSSPSSWPSHSHWSPASANPADWGITLQVSLAAIIKESIIYGCINYYHNLIRLSNVHLLCLTVSTGE